MSVELRKALLEQAERDYERERREIDERVGSYRDLLLKVATRAEYSIQVWVEGGDAGFNEDKRDLNLLERSGLVKGAYGFTEHNMFRKYALTELGREVARKLQEEASS